MSLSSHYNSGMKMMLLSLLPNNQSDERNNSLGNLHAMEKAIML